MGGAEHTLLILDLDGTLLDTAAVGVNSEPCDFTSASQGEGYAETDTFLRPGLSAFIRDVQAHGYQLAVWTAAPRLYADAMIDGIDRVAAPGFRDSLCGRIFTDELTTCSFERGRVIRTKDLSRLTGLTGIPLHRCLIVDDTKDTYALNVRNALPVDTFEAGYGDDDPTLAELADFLGTLDCSPTAVLDVSNWQYAPSSGAGPLTAEAVREQTNRAKRCSMRNGPPQTAWVGQGSVPADPESPAPTQHSASTEARPAHGPATPHCIVA